MRTLIKNGKIILPNRIVENKSVIINGNKIEAVIDDAKIGAYADYVIDAKGLYVSPGFVDIHIHGANGGDCSDASKESLEKISTYLAKCGVTSFCATTMTLGEEALCEIANVIGEYKGNEAGAKIAGINHMAWLLEIKDLKGNDLYPIIKEKASKKNAGEKHKDMTRFEYIKYLGYYCTESSEHNAEYNPFFIKSKYPEII